MPTKRGVVINEVLVVHPPKPMAEWGEHLQVKEPSKCTIWITTCIFNSKIDTYISGKR